MSSPQAACRPHLVFELVQPRKAWVAVAHGLLKRHPEYECAWLNFRIVPATVDAFRVPDVEPTGLGDRRRGPMSYNLFCAPGKRPVDVAPYAAARGLLRTVHNISHDPLYVGPDCADYEAQLRATGPGVYESIVGAGSGTICSSDA